jgi:hypothetical protein
VAAVVMLVASGMNVVRAGLPALGTSPPGASNRAASSPPANELARAVAFRSSFGLRADMDYVRESYDGPASFPDDSWGVPLNDVEAMDLRDRLRVQESIGRASAFARLQDGYAGVYLDQLSRHGMPVFLFRGDAEQHRAELGARLPSGIDFDVRSVERSYADLTALANKVDDDIGVLAEQNVSVTEVGIRIEPNLVVIGVGSDLSSAEPALRDRYGASVQVVADASAQTDSCTSIVVCPPMKSGVEIHPHGAHSSGAGYCTVAFLARYFNVFTHYVAVTAGHCVDLNNSNSNLNWYFNDPVTDGTSNKIGLQTAGYWYAGSNADVGYIQIPSDSAGYPYPEDFNQILVKNAPLVGHVTGTFHNADQPDHAQLCRIGYGQYLYNGSPKSCGQIVGFDKDKNSCDDMLPPNCYNIHNQNVVDFDSHGGDSGAPYYSNPDTGSIDATKMYGVHTHSYKDTECENNPAKCLGWFSPIDSALGEVSSHGVDLIPCLNAACNNSYTYP